MTTTLNLKAGTFSVTFTARFATEEAAASFTSLFPKSTKMRACEVRCSTGNYWWVSSSFSTLKNGTIGDKNEAGIRRYRAIVKACEKAGIELAYDANAYSDSIPTREALESTF